MADESYPKPFDGGITRFHEQFAPEEVRSAITNARRDSIPNPSCSYKKRWSRKKYNTVPNGLQVKPGKLQTRFKAEGARIVVVIEGRSVAGKGGTVKRFSGFMHPQEPGSWRLESPRARNEPGSISCVTFFTCRTPAKLRRFLDRNSDRLKHRKLSRVGVAGLCKQGEFTAAIRETFERSDSSWAPWRVKSGDDKRRAKVAAVQSVLDREHYPDKDVPFSHGSAREVSAGTRMFDA